MEEFEAHYRNSGWFESCDNNLKWDRLDSEITFQSLMVWIEQGRIRIKPETVTLYEHANYGQNSWCEQADRYPDSTYTGRMIEDGIISNG